MSKKKNSIPSASIDNLEKFQYHCFFSWGLDDNKHKVIEFLKYSSEEIRKEISSDILQNMETSDADDSPPVIISDIKKQIIEFKVKSVYKQASLHFFHSNREWTPETLQQYLEEDEMRRLRTLEGSQIAI